MARKSTIGKNPLDLIIPTKAAVKAKPAPKKKAVAKAQPEPEEWERLTIQIPKATVERARNAAFWDRVPLAHLVEEGLNMVVNKLEKANGEEYPEREKALKRGRPFK